MRACDNVNLHRLRQEERPRVLWLCLTPCWWSAAMLGTSTDMLFWLEEAGEAAAVGVNPVLPRRRNCPASSQSPPLSCRCSLRGWMTRSSAGLSLQTSEMNLESNKWHACSCSNNVRMLKGTQAPQWDAVCLLLWRQAVHSVALGF